MDTKIKHALSIICVSITFTFHLSPFTSAHAQDTTDHVLLHIGGRTFFIDNEYFGDRISGYTLPGFVLQPKVEWQISNKVTLSGGAHWLYYWGARDYPAVAAYGAYPLYDSVSNVLHLLPWLQTKIHFSPDLELTLGCLDVDGHDLPMPLYNFERSTVADPETGFRLKYWGEWLKMDFWCDWREYIWDRSPVPERFTAGASGKLMLNNENWTLYLPLHFIVQHEGGQNMSVPHNINNNFNGAAGLGLKTSWHNSQLDISCRAMWYHQHGNAAVPFSNGWGVYPEVDFSLPSDWLFMTSYWHSKNFVPLLGSWHYSSLSANTEGLFFDRTRVITLYGGKRWQFSDNRPVIRCNLIVYGTLYHYLPSTGTFADGTTKDYGHRNQFAVGAILSFYPTVKLH